VDAGSFFSFIPATALKTSTDGGTTYTDVTAFSSPIHGNFQFSLTGVPEPSRTLLMLSAFGAMLLRRRRK